MLPPKPVTSPAAARSKVVLPHPLGPTMQRNSPLPTSSETRSRARNGGLEATAGKLTDTSRKAILVWLMSAQPFPAAHPPFEGFKAIDRSDADDRKNDDGGEQAGAVEPLA